MNQHSIEIATMINNAIVILWQQGHIESAQATLKFEAYRSPDPRAELARVSGRICMFLDSDDEILAGNFPSSSCFFLPRADIAVIAQEIFAERKNVLRELERMQASIESDDDDDDEQVRFSSELPDLGSSVPVERRKANLPGLGPDE